MVTGTGRWFLTDENQTERRDRFSLNPLDQSWRFSTMIIIVFSEWDKISQKIQFKDINRFI